MGKSVKKHPYCKDYNKKKHYMKRLANRSIRARFKSKDDIGNGNNYRKHFNSWSIAEWTFYYTERQAKFAYDKYSDPDFYYNRRWCNNINQAKKEAKEFKEKYPTFESYLHRNWSRWFKNK